MSVIGRSDFAKLLGSVELNERDLAHLFENGLSTNANAGPNAPTDFPAINAWEDETSIIVETELPGFRVEDIDLQVTGDNQLSIKGERQPPAVEGHWHRRERGFGQFARLVTLPFEVQAGNVDARMQNGVLNIRLLKKPNDQSRKIEVKVV